MANYQVVTVVSVKKIHLKQVSLFFQDCWGFTVNGWEKQFGLRRGFIYDIESHLKVFSATVSWRSHTLHAAYPGELTYDRSGFDGVHDLLQGFQVWVIMSKLLLLVVQVAPSLRKK